MIAAIQPAAPSLFLNVARVQSLRGPISVPVEPIHAVQAHFEHIVGVPARGDGVPLFKLQILDSLIDRLLSFRENVPEQVHLAALPEAEIEPLMAALEQRLRSRVLQEVVPFGGLFPQTGMLIDLAA